MTIVEPVIGTFEFKELKLASYVFTVPNPVGLIFFSHGISEYTIAEKANIDFCTNNNFNLIALDLPGIKIIY
jgi:alpha-beta hydrolase superfamily lysophospholipase